MPRSSMQSDHTYEDLTIVKRLRLKLYGLVSLASQKHFARHCEKGEEDEADRGRGERWEDNIREWTGLELAKSQRAVENRENGGNWL